MRPCGCGEKLLREIAEASAQMTLALEEAMKEELLAKLRVKAAETVDGKEKSPPKNPRLVKNLLLYDRHVFRIASLLRVLDPDDEGAVFNPHTATEQTIKDELRRRQSELKSVEQYLLTVEVDNG